MRRYLRWARHIVFAHLVFFSIAMADAKPSPHNYYVLAVSACPPWKTVQAKEWAEATNRPQLLMSEYSCRNSVKVFVDALKKRYGIPEKNIDTLIDKQVTYGNVLDQLDQLSKKATDNTIVFLYFGLHGAILKQFNHSEEVLILWSEDRPKDLLSSIDEGHAIMVSTLAQAISKIQAMEVIVIFDSCHSGLSLEDFDRDEDHTVITSTGVDNLANFTKDYDYLLFTKVLSSHLADHSVNAISFDNLFNQVSKEVHAHSKIICKRDKDLMQMSNLNELLCIQMPEIEGETPDFL